MLCFRSRNPSQTLLFLALFLFASSTFALSNLHIPSDLHEALIEKGYGGRSLLATWRFLQEETVDNSSLILAEKRTHRKDFFDNLNYYNGGWNISNSHYWSSVVSTGVPFFGFAAAWFVLFGLCLCFICLHHCCCLREPYGYSRTAYALSLIFLILFTIAAIVGCIVLYIGQGKFHDSTSNTLGYVVDQANTTAKKLNDVSGFLNAAKGIGVESVILSPNFQKDIDNIEAKINSSAAFLSKQTGDNAENIQNGLDGMRLALIILAAVMLFLAFLGFLFSIFGMQCLVYTLVIGGWILVTGTFILCGVFLLLHNVVADTCVAMDEWVLNPTAHTALDDILPCVDNATAQETLLKTKDATYRLVDGVNSVISSIANFKVPPNAGAISYNQSGPLMPLLCNPFHSNLTDRQCAVIEVPLSNASQVYKNYICEVSGSDICTTPGRITPSMYTKIAAAVNVSYGLYRNGPFLTELQDCTFVRDTFTVVRKEYCPGLRRYTQWIYTGLVMVSAAVMLSLIFWVIYARERRHRVYTKRYMARSADGQGKTVYG